MARHARSIAFQLNKRGIASFLFWPWATKNGKLPRANVRVLQNTIKLHIERRTYWKRSKAIGNKRSLGAGQASALKSGARSAGEVAVRLPRDRTSLLFLLSSEPSLIGRHRFHPICETICEIHLCDHLSLQSQCGAACSLRGQCQLQCSVSGLYRYFSLGKVERVVEAQEQSGV
jgi:hypothetical protein